MGGQRLGTERSDHERHHAEQSDFETDRQPNRCPDFYNFKNRFQLGERAQRNHRVVGVTQPDVDSHCKKHDCINDGTGVAGSNHPHRRNPTPSKNQDKVGNDVHADTQKEDRHDRCCVRMSFQKSFQREQAEHGGQTPRDRA